MAAKQAATADAAETKWSRRDLFAGAAGAFGVVAAESLRSAGDRLDRVIGAWIASARGVAKREPSGCVPCAR